MACKANVRLHLSCGIGVTPGTWPAERVEALVGGDSARKPVARKSGLVAGARDMGDMSPALLPLYIFLYAGAQEEMYIAG